MVAGIVIATIPPVMRSIASTVLVIHVSVPAVKPWSFPAFEVTFTSPPFGESNEARYRWIAEPYRNAVFVVFFFVYHAALTVAVIGMALLAVALRRLQYQVDIVTH